MGCQCSKVCLRALRRQPNRAVSRSDSEDSLDTRPKRFGVPLADLEKNGLMTYGLPSVVCDLVEFLRKGLRTPYILAENGRVILVKALRETFDRGEKIKLCKRIYVNTAAGVLKSFLRDIPDGLIPASVLPRLAQAYQENERDTYQAILKEAIKSLPFSHYHLLHYLCHFLVEVAEHSAENKMDIGNLASVLAPCFFRLAPATDAVTQMTQFQLAHSIMADLLRGYTEIFDCNRPNEDKVREPEQLTDYEVPTPEPCEDLLESSLLVPESSAAPEDDMAADTISMPFPHREMINKENAPSGCCMQGECDGMPRVDI